jgi:hypothetical protein
MKYWVRRIQTGQPRKAAFQMSFCLKSRVVRFITRMVGNHTTNSPGKIYLPK